MDADGIRRGANDDGSGEQPPVIELARVLAKKEFLLPYFLSHLQCEEEGLLKGGHYLADKAKDRAGTFKPEFLKQ